MAWCNHKYRDDKETDRTQMGGRRRRKYKRTMGQGLFFTIIHSNCKKRKRKEKKKQSNFARLYTLCYKGSGEFVTHLEAVDGYMETERNLLNFINLNYEERMRLLCYIVLLHICIVRLACAVQQ